MQKKRNLFLLLISMFFSLTAFSQSLETVKIIKKTNDTINFVTTLRYYKGSRLVFPDDNKDFIKGKLDGKKTKLSKALIKEIHIIRGGAKYLVIRNRGDQYRIGYFISRGKKDFFKTFSYNRETVSLIDNNSFIDNKQVMSVNKVVSVAYYIYKNGTLREFDRKRGTLALSQSCYKFKSYVAEQKKIKSNAEIEKAMRYYNKVCE